MAILNNSNAISSGGYDINNSLRFRSSASAYLSRTPASASNRTTMTFSAWVKRGALGANQSIFNARATSSPYSLFHFYSNDTLVYEDSNTAFLQTTQVFRDPSAWYHIVFVLDTTQATAANRVKIYVNGSQVTALSTATYPAQNANTNYNTATAHAISSQTPSFSNEFFDGYMTEVNFVDGQALTPSSFGETDTTTGSWKPKAYTSTYGTNGFYLKFSDIATTSGSNAGLGKDFSGNTNYWTTNNISVTAGTTYDAMIDSPTLTSATVANYATWNPLLFYSSTVPTITNGNLTAGWNNTGMHCGSTMTCSSTGKTYAEFTLTTAGTTRIGIKDITNYSQYGGGYTYVANSGQIRDTNDTTVQTVASSTNGDIIGIAVDLSANTLQFYKNNTAIGTAVTIANSSNWAFWVGQNSSATPQQVDANFGQRPFSYTPPTGFVRLNTYNLPDSTIKKGNTVMDATLYTGTGATLSITNAGSFKPDFIWTKCRSNVVDNCLVDAVRGGNKILYSNLTNAEDTASFIDSFNTGGYTINSGAGGGGNTNTRTYVGWQWQAGQGSTSSNTSGSITSTVSVNTTAGFSVVTWTGNGGASTIGHGLGIAPKFIIVRTRNYVNNWFCYHASLANTEVMYLDTTGAKDTSRTDWNSTSPTSSVFSVNGGNTNRSSINMLAYCWAAIAGYSAFGSYTGNGSTDGPFSYFGFRPKFVMIKNVTTAGYPWVILDSVRNTYNPENLELYPNTSGAEASGGTTYIEDFLSNGFKVRQTDATFNASGSTYIYMAFAENPFKNALAR